MEFIYVWILGIQIFQVFTSTLGNVCPEENTINGQCFCDSYDAPGKVQCTGLKNIEVFEKGCKFENEYYYFDLNNNSIVYLSAKCGALTRISSNDFIGFNHILHLDLSHNQITEISEDAFKIVFILEQLDLSHNNLTSINPKWFQPLNKLVRLSLAENKLHHISPNAFSAIYSLQVLNLSKNFIPELPARLFANLTSLRNLDLSHNQISLVDKDALSDLVYLKSLNLSYNRVKHLFPEAFASLTSLTFLNLSNNWLSSLDETIVNSNVKVDLKGNAWDCKKWIIKNTTSFLYQSYSEVCQVQNSTGWWEDYTGNSIQIRGHPICDTCVCTVRNRNDLVTVNCSNQNFQTLPASLPDHTSTVILDNNQVKSLALPPGFSPQWNNVIYLHLRNNSVKSVKDLEGSILSKKLIILNLSKNKISDIPVYILDHIENLSHLYLADNPWRCDCDNTVSFQTWLHGHNKIVDDIEGITCGADGGLLENRPIYKLAKSQLCPQSSESIHYLDVLNAMMGVIILLMVMKLGYDYWGQKRTGKLPRFFKLQIW